MFEVDPAVDLPVEHMPLMFPGAAFLLCWVLDCLTAKTVRMYFLFLFLFATQARVPDRQILLGTGQFLHV